jgi:adenine-specific DNA-methyltransferase
MTEKMKFETPNLTNENKAKIAALFPGVVTDGKVNFDLLRSMLGEDVFADEAYEFTWVGKRAAIAEAGRPIRKTLRPVVIKETTPTGTDSTGAPYMSSGSRDWDTTENLYFEGDNLEVLKLLQESYLGKIKMIYIDPPYNTGNDFVYRDKFTTSREDYVEEAGVYDEDGDRLFKNTETNGRFHSDWCSMIYPRLVLARNLLREDGVIFISIDDNECHNLRKICDEVFGVENFVTEFAWEKKKKPSFLHKNIGKLNDYIICYVKNTLQSLPFSVETTTEGKKYPFNNAGNGLAILTFPAGYVKFNMPDGNVEPQDMSEGAIVTRLLDSLVIKDGRNVDSFRLEGEWRYSQAKLNEIVANDEEIVISKVPFRPNHIKAGGEVKKMKNVLSPTHYQMETNEDATSQMISLFGVDLFDNPKPVKLVNYLVRAVTYNDLDAIILDFFSGSGTTAHSIMQLNSEDGGKRKFIMVQLPETCAEGTEAAKAGYKNICEIGKERIRRAGDKIKDEAGLTGQGIDIGFRVLKLDETNMNDVYYAAGDYTQDMISMLQSNIKEDRTDMDLLFGCLLDWGLPLSLPHTHEKIEGFTVHTYNEGDLIACFEERISENVVREIAKRQPLRVVFRDSSFTSSPEKINVVEIFKLLAPNTTVRVI